MGVVGVGDWSAICKQLLDNVPNKFSSSRTKMKWLKDNFSYTDNFTSAVERQQYMWNNDAIHVGILDELEDILLLFDQQLEAGKYFDSIIQECILIEFLATRNIWYVKVSLIIFTTVEMHEFDQVMRQFEFMQSISPLPQELDELHKITLWGRIDKD
ncbi:hypothetical protein Gotri_003982 [Gossypium trilobum]|uniref:Uncharacterized protein n=1 Tax=Gossypium trilobum TaxID=34281 RepID=A0A7J9F3A4_9ROSI|nr:hypothetical protein [Gossypium trilobum]